MSQTDFELLVIGGGINGTGIARDAAGRGISVLLVEQDDLAAHTSSASTKLIHGGLRYLEYFEFGLVGSALRERERLLGLAPHLVRPLEFVLPQTNSPRPRWLIQLGLALYDRLGGRSSLPRSKRIRLRGSCYADGLLSHVEHGFSYADCRVDDSRLVILNALDAAERGAQIRPRTRFVHATRDTDGWRCTLLHTESGASITVSARALVNAAGPWVAEVLANRVKVQRPKSVRLVKGSHIVVPRLYEGEHAFMLQNPDRRIVFVIPYETRYSLIGTTEIPVDAPGAASAITALEIDYLCETANRHFRRKLTPRDVVRSFSGTRPLFEDAAENASAVTRDYVLDLDTHDHSAPLMSIFGGKITTYRKLAEAALHKLADYFPNATGAWTADVALPGGDIETSTFDDFVVRFEQRFPFLDRTHALRLCRAYGTRAERILHKSAAIDDLGLHFGGDLYQAEVDYLIDREWARSAEDVLLRRSKLTLHVPANAATLLQQYMEHRRPAHIGNSIQSRAPQRAANWLVESQPD
jgi:glycerol-3-phosphate dehydrogenase